MGDEIPPADAAFRLNLDSVRLAGGQLKRSSASIPAKPLPGSANRVHKAAAGKSKAAAEVSLAVKWAAVGAAEDLDNLEDNTDRSEDHSGETKHRYTKKKPDGTECGAIIKNEKHSTVSHSKDHPRSSVLMLPTLFARLLPGLFSRMGNDAEAAYFRAWKIVLSS
ncbi:hypothetical protein DL764_001111 [Monosporascus ibericus]|uniref:Uncharacterized protein n=1 Tax=Monosporascus ibericus TaxID=155417 RepID=A0A4Q4TQR0_9PEZI|nr:hypothetical protein DL764_001111 [Monosporascus ibericus]